MKLEGNTPRLRLFGFDHRTPATSLFPALEKGLLFPLWDRHI